jgi:DNA-binding transcriptional ArsR family regulator
MLADPTRRRLVELTARHEMSVGALVEATGASQPAVSKQLAVLREAGLVKVRREGKRRLYRARPEELTAMQEWLRLYGPQFNARIDALEDHLNRK